MKRVKCAELLPDMVIAEDVFGRSGEVLMPCGTHVSERAIKLLEGWGIASVSVEGQDEENAGNHEAVAALEKEIYAKFVESAKDNPLIAQLVKLCVKRQMKKQAAASEQPANP